MPFFLFSIIPCSTLSHICTDIPFYIIAPSLSCPLNSFVILISFSLVWCDLFFCSRCSFSLLSCLFEILFYDTSFVKEFLSFFLSYFMIFVKCLLFLFSFLLFVYLFFFFLVRTFRSCFNQPRSIPLDFLLCTLFFRLEGAFTAPSVEPKELITIEVHLSLDITRSLIVD